MLLMFGKHYENNSGYGNYTDGSRLPFNLHVLAGLKFSDIAELDYRYGIMNIYDGFNGTDQAVNLRFNIWDQFILGIIGMDFFQNNGESHGVTDYAVSGGSTTFYSVGLGCNLTNHFSLNISYYIPREKIYGYDYVNNFDGTTNYYNKIINGVLVFGFQYRFIVL